MHLHTRIHWTTDVTSVAIAPQDTLFATGSRDGLVVIRSLPNGDIVQTLPTQPAAVWSLAFAPDGTLLALGSDDNPGSPDGTVELWDTTTWSYHGTYSDEDTGGTWSLAFGSDSQQLAIGHTDGCTRLWSVPDRQVLTTFPVTCEIPLVAMARNGSFFAYACDATVYVYNLQTNTLTNQFASQSLYFHSIAFAPSEPALAASPSDGSVSLWNLVSGRLANQLLEGIEVRCFAFSPTGHELICGCDDGYLRIVHLATDQLIQALPAHAGWIRSIAVACNGAVLISSGTDGDVCIWHTHREEKHDQG